MDFKSILVPENNGKRNLCEHIHSSKSYASKYQKHIACSYGCKLVCVDDEFSKPFKTHSGEDFAYNLLVLWSKRVNIVVKWWKSVLTENFWQLKKTIQILRTLLNVASVTMIMLMMMLK